MKNPEPRLRRRLPRETRHRQLLDVAAKIVRSAGTDALTLGTLAEQAGITKPVVYDHFETRNGLLLALYQEFDRAQTEVIDAALQASEPSLAARAKAIASSYVDCVLLQGREMPGIIAALAGSPELEKVKREYQQVFIEKCRRILTPFTKGGTIPASGFWAMLGAADALSAAAASGEIKPAHAKEELREIIAAMVRRSRRP